MAIISSGKFDVINYANYNLEHGPLPFLSRGIPLQEVSHPDAHGRSREGVHCDTGRYSGQNLWGQLTPHARHGDQSAALEHTGDSTLAR